MKFHVAWDSLEKENSFLKFVVVIVLIISIFLCSVLGVVGGKDPLVIEKGCYSRVIDKVLPTPTDDEIKVFLEEAIKARFNSNWSNPGLLSHEQIVFRDKEQRELEKQKMYQTVIVNDVKLTNDNITVDSDRMIAVGEIRSSFKFPLKIQLKSETRSDGNPYGLILTDVQEIHEEKK